MQVRLVPNLQLGDRIIGPTRDPVANRALYQRYAKRLQARLGIGFQVYLDTSDGYDLLHAHDYDTNTCWVVATEVYQALTDSAVLTHHRILPLSDQALILKTTQSIEQQLRQPPLTH
ncbi:hypothetical protein [Lactiplantibacillus paraplantarum]|uniref:hypothetical protein n=1 Tax=Lactiplantibacillus paraplantarum TaxID=60520 RepID=UPI0020735D39|nr:hypothetical protein [Lactiplantibacillus paraplantarum]